MGVDLQTYRCKVGTFNGGRGSVSVCLPTISNSSAVRDTIMAFDVMGTGAVGFIDTLLLMSGIEPNPGPPVSHYMNDPLFKNWVRAAYAFKYLKSGLVDFVSNELYQRHNNLIQMVTRQNSNVQPCSVCTSTNLLPDHGSHGCNHRNKRECFCRQSPSTRRPCPNHFCSNMYHIIVEDHAYKSPCLPNSKSRTQLNWYNDAFECAKCYLTTPTKATSLQDVDCTGFLSLVINNQNILNSIDDVETFKQCRKDRNTVFHSGNFKLTDSELAGFIDNMILVLEDRKCLINDQRSQHAVISLKQPITLVSATPATVKLKTDNIHIADEDVVGMMKDATSAIRELGEDVQQDLATKRQKILNEFNAISAERTSEINKQTSDALQKVDERKDSALSEIKQKQNEATSDVVLKVDKHKDAALNEIKQKQNEATRDVVLKVDKHKDAALNEIKQKQNEALSDVVQKVDKHKDAALSEIKQKQNEATSDVVQKVDKHKDIALSEIKQKQNEATSDVVQKVDKHKDAALSEIKQKQNEATRDVVQKVDKHKNIALSEMKQKQNEATSDVVHKIDVRKDAALSEIKQKQLEATSDIKQKVDDYKDMAVGEMKQVQLDATSVITKQKDDAINTIRQHIQVSHEVVQKDLVRFYLQRCRTIPVSPLFDNKDEHLLKIYQNPTMYREEQRKESKQISGYKSIFYKENVAMKQVYVTGDAGVGKTSFCTRMCLLWSMAKSGNTFEKEDKELQEDLEFMAKFDFVFYINLRDTSHTHVIDMIFEQLVYNSKDKYESVIESILRDEPCLIILDALDEWDPATTDRKPYKVPERIYSEQCFCLTTCRPYRIEKVRLSHKKEVDHLIKITGLHGDSSQSYIEHVIRYMNDEHSSSRSADDFTDEVEKCGLTEQLCIPIFISHIVMLWFEQKLTGMSRALIYANILEMLFRRAEKKNITCPPSPPSTWKLPDSLSGMEHLNKHVRLLYNVCHLSFRALFKQDNTVSSLVFTRQQLQSQPYNFSLAESDFLCRLGLLSQNEVWGCFTEEKLNISFIHQSYMEFLAALFITSFDERNLFSDITEQWGSLDEFLQFENLYVLLAGFSYERVKLLFESIHVTLADDLSSCRYEAVFRYWNSYKEKIKSLQTIVTKCYKEVSKCNFNIVLKLEDFVFDNVDDEADSDTRSANDDKSKVLVPSHAQSLKQLLKSNSQCVKSLYSVSGKYSVEFNQIKDLQCLRVGEIVPVDYAQFTQLVMDNKSTLKTLCIEGDPDTPLIPQLPGISELSMRRNHRLVSCLPCIIRRRRNTVFQNLTALSLREVSMQHSSLHTIVTFLSNNIRIEHIELNTIDCENHWPGDDDCSFILNLSHHTKLTSLDLLSVTILCHALNTSSLKSLYLSPFSKKSTSCIVDVLNSIKDSQLEYLAIYGDHILNSNTVDTLMSTIQTLPRIEYLTLFCMNLHDDVLILPHIGVKQVEIYLYDISMSFKLFHSFIESIANNASVKYVLLSECKILSVDGETCREMSVKESFECMTEYLNKQSSINIIDKNEEENWLSFASTICK